MADVNHDGTSETVDLFPKYNLNQNGAAWSTDAHYALYRYMIYTNFAFRYWLNEDLYNGFDSGIRSAMHDISTAYEETNFIDTGCYSIASIEYVNEKVKCPSITELGIKDTNNPSNYMPEGSMYPIFSQIAYTTGSSALLKNIDGNNAYYWSRSVIPSYWGGSVNGPAFIRPINGGSIYYADVCYGGMDSSSGIISAGTEYTQHNGTTVNMGSPIGIVAIGVCAFIRFGKR